MSLELVESPQPYFIPGYTGHCPQYKYREGATYGSQTHKLLLDPTVQHSEYLVLSDRTANDYEVVRRPAQKDIDVVESRFQHGDPVYKHPMLPGYEGFIPRQHASLGQSYTVSATEALSAFEQQQLANKAALHQLERIVAVQGGQWQPRSQEDRLLAESEFKLPLQDVRPEMAGILRDLPMDEPPIPPPKSGDQLSPYFCDNSDPEKYIKQGFGGHVPFGYAEFGGTHERMTNSALCDFTSNYRHRQSTEWAPVTVSRPDPPLLIHPSEIYHRHVGQLPNYMGHIPGARFRFGKTFGNDTRDAKRWLRGDFDT